MCGKFGWLWGLGVSVLIALVDQLTKIMVVRNFEVGEVREIIPGFFNLILVYNPGVAFGLFADSEWVYRQIFLLGMALVAVGIVFYFFFVEYRSDPVARVSLAMIFGGAVGNIVDRLRFGEVVDFLDFYLGSSHWPAFNVADSAICIGVVVLIFRVPRQGRQQPSEQSAD